MNRCVCAFLFLQLSFLGYGQIGQWSQLHTEISDSIFFKRKISIYAQYDFSSNAVRNAMAQRFLLGGYISEDVKSQTYHHLNSEHNTIGLEAKSGVDFSLNKSKCIWHFSFFTRQQLYARFSGDLFQLVFSGNGLFENRVANFVPFSALSLQTHQLAISWHLFLNTKLGIEIGIQGIGARRFIEADFYSGSMNTSLHFEHIQANLAYDIHRTLGVSSSLIPQSMGGGAAVALQLHYKPTDAWHLRAYVHDLGLLYFPSTDLLNGRSELNLNAFNFSSFQIPIDSVVKNVNTDSLGGLFQNSWKESSSTLMLPIHFGFQIHKKLKPHWSAHLAAQYIHYWMRIPAFQGLISRQLGDFNLGVGFRMGGYGSINSMIEASYSIKQRIQLRMQLIQIENAFFNSTSSGQALLLRVSYGL